MSTFRCSTSAVLGPEWGSRTSSPFPTPHRGKSPEAETVERPFGEKRPEPLQPAPPPPPLPSQYTPASSLTFHTLTKGVHSEGRCRALRLGGFAATCLCLPFGSATLQRDPCSVACPCHSGAGRPRPVAPMQPLWPSPCLQVAEVLPAEGDLACHRVGVGTGFFWLLIHTGSRQWGDPVWLIQELLWTPLPPS